MRQAVWQSFSIHLALAVLLIAAAFIFRNKPLPKMVKIEIREVAPPTQAPTVQINEQPAPPPKVAARKIFGLSRKSLTSDKPGAVEVKAGNTLAKDIDQDKLLPGDADSLPVPAEEYLVNQMPRLKAEVKIPYPPQAKQKNIEGAVVMEVLIDDKGKVRSARLLEGPGYGLNEAAMEAIYRFEFFPAQMDKKAVAVKIRYAYRFILN